MKFIDFLKFFINFSMKKTTSLWFLYSQKEFFHKNIYINTIKLIYRRGIDHLLL